MRSIVRFLSVAVTSSFLAHAEVRDNRCTDRALGRARVCDNAPLFEFATATGVGMTAACACTNPTGTKGEALTLNRSSSAFCTKGHISSGIANGDLVSCGNDLARVMPGGDGTGVVGLLIERPVTNVVLRSQELDNAAWTPTNVTAAAPTVTANNATAPDGTSTAERIDFAATAVGEESSMVQAGVGGAGFTGSTSLYIKGVSGSGTIDICTNTGAADVCTACAFVSATWTRCSQRAATVGAATALSVGNLTRINGGTTRSANNVYLWGVQSEAAGIISSYIPTAGTSAARAAETSSIPLVLSNATGSIAATLVPETNLTTSTWDDHALATVSTAGPTYKLIMEWRRLAGAALVYGVTGTVSRASTGLTALGENRISFYWNGTDGTVTTPEGSSGSGTFTTAATTLLEVGSASGAFFQAHGVVKKICVDPSPSRCR